MIIYTKYFYIFLFVSFMRFQRTYFRLERWSINWNIYHLMCQQTFPSKFTFFGSTCDLPVPVDAGTGFVRVQIFQPVPVPQQTRDRYPCGSHYPWQSLCVYGTWECVQVAQSTSGGLKQVLAVRDECWSSGINGSSCGASKMVVNTCGEL
jgi:hypothetical protein